MIIRDFRLEDLNKVIPLIEEFCKESLESYGMYLKPAYIKQVAEKYADNTLLAEVDNKVVGIISGIIVDMPTSGEKAFQEVIWFVTKKYRRYGVLLYNTLEKKCKESGIRFILMVSMANSKADELERFYKKIGFRLTERQYMKDLGGR